jgi:arsenite methyltransferase
MVSEAEAFNQELIRAGRATFRLASVEAIPFAADAFDHALAVNTIYFWPDPVRALAEIRRVLRPDGVLFVLAGTPEEMAKAPFTPYGFRVYDEAQLRKLHAEAGSRHVADVGPNPHNRARKLLRCRRCLTHRFAQFAMDRRSRHGHR